MSEIIHEGSYTEQKVYTRPPNTYTCDTCGKNLGQNKGIELQLSYDINDHDTDYVDANFCSFLCLHEYPHKEHSKEFTRRIRTSQNHFLSISGFRWPEIALRCKVGNCQLPVYKIGLCTEHLEEKSGL